jgi:PadR family transcriptional regulator PadR
LSQQRQTPENGSHSAEEKTYKDIRAYPRNWLVPVVLVILREYTTYGYDLMERTLQLGFEAMNPGTLYRTLRKMEQEGLCDSEWETASAGPARRMYSITNAGEAYLDLWVKSLEQYQSTMDAFFQAYRRRSSSRTRSGSQEMGSEPPP